MTDEGKEAAEVEGGGEATNRAGSDGTHGARNLAFVACFFDFRRLCHRITLGHLVHRFSDLALRTIIGQIIFDGLRHRTRYGIKQLWIARREWAREASPAFC